MISIHIEHSYSSLISVVIALSFFLWFSFSTCSCLCLSSISARALFYYSTYYYFASSSFLIWWFWSDSTRSIYDPISSTLKIISSFFVTASLSSSNYKKSSCFNCFRFPLPINSPFRYVPLLLKSLTYTSTPWAIIFFSSLQWTPLNL